MLSARQQYCLTHIGITQWSRRPTPVTEAGVQVELVAPEPASVQPSTRSAQVVASLPPTAPPVTSSQAPVEAEDLTSWEQTLAAIQACQQCELSSSCTRKVAGKGPHQADLMIIGEAPGHDEDIQGIPFVGRAGQLLDKMLQAIQLDPATVYITNILKCRPPENRIPKADEIRTCAPFLRAQIALVKPKVLLSVGRISAHNLLHNDTPLGQLRGKQFSLPESDIPLLVTYHPAYLLRNPHQKAQAWEDLKALQRLLKHAVH